MPERKKRKQHLQVWFEMLYYLLLPSPPLPIRLWQFMGGESPLLGSRNIAPTSPLLLRLREAVLGWFWDAAGSVREAAQGIKSPVLEGWRTAAHDRVFDHRKAGPALT